MHGIDVDARVELPSEMQRDWCLLSQVELDRLWLHLLCRQRHWARMTVGASHWHPFEERKIAAWTVSCVQWNLIAKWHTNTIHCLHRLSTNELEKRLGAKQSDINVKNVEARHFESYCGTWAINDISLDDTLISYHLGGGEILDFHLAVLVSVKSDRNGKIQMDAPESTISNGCSKGALKHVVSLSVEIYIWYELIFVRKISMESCCGWDWKKKYLHDLSWVEWEEPLVDVLIQHTCPNFSFVPFL